MHDPPFGTAPPEYRLSSDTRIGAVHLQVADLDRSIAYYTTVLGFHVLSREGAAASLGSAQTSRVLVRLTARPGARPAPPTGRLGLFHFAILLPDRPSLGRFLRHLAERGDRPGMADHAVSEALYLSDPDGLGIEVYADRPRETWRTAPGGELYMTTEPLDVRGLLSAGGSEPWSGIPGGTVIGHVHLHVGDLEQAEAFYHLGLGFDKTVWSYPGALFFSAGSYHHHLGTNTWSSGPAATELDARLLWWELMMPEEDTVKAATHITRRGHVATPIANGSHVVDPWGTAVQLIAIES
jgi:catechol 2,3-dioxygenase